MPDLASLIARVEAEETGRELDAEVARAAGWQLDRSGPDDRWQVPGYANLWELPEFSVSLDSHAALPGRIVRVELHGNRWSAVLDRHEGHVGRGPTEIAARLAARLRGMQG